MKAKLDPRALAAANYLKSQKVFSEGPIIPWWLGAALPPRSERRGWRDYVALHILSDIISAHRLKNGQVFFRGALFQVNREDWAQQIPTTLKEISLTLTWLAEDLGVIGRVQRVRLVDGQPCGSQTFAWPIGPRLQELLDYFQEHGHPMPVKSREPDPDSDEAQARDGLESNSTPGFEATPSPGSRQLHSPLNGNSSLSSATRPKAPARNGPVHVNGHAKVNVNGQPHAPNSSSTAAAPPPWSPPPPPRNIQVVTEQDRIAWRKAMRFRALCQEAIVRSQTVSSSNFTLPDKKAAYDYFQAHPEIGGTFPVAVAIRAWQLAREGAQPKNKRRSLYHVPHSRDPRQFLSSMDSGKVEAEVGMFVDVNAWKNLRWFFTESELVYWGWKKDKIPVMALEPDQLWEYDPDAPSYYLDRHRDFPPEVAAVVNQAAAGDKEPSS